MNNRPQNITTAIMITAGGTGGHVIPASVLYQALKTRDQHVHFVTDVRGQSFTDIDMTADITVIPLPRYQGGLPTKIKFLWALILSIYRCWRLIKRHHITTVVGFGGYIAMPALVAAVIAGCKIVLHEQNSVLGRVNRWFGGVADKIALSTSQIAKCPPRLQQKCVLTGLPIRAEIEQLRHSLSTAYCRDRPDPQLHILIIGGSQAAGYFSQLLPQALALMPALIRHQLYIHQQCRSEDIDNLQTIYRQMDVKAELKTFFDDMPTELMRADLVVARAGASSIAEISAVGKPALFIPYPYAVDDHQTSNAEMAVHHGGGWWQPQLQFNPNTLNQLFQYVIDNPQILIIMSEAARRYGCTDATAKLIRLI